MSVVVACQAQQCVPTQQRVVLRIDGQFEFYNVGLTDWMSDIGGISKSIMFTLVWLFGGASFFSSRVEMMLHLYSDKGFFSDKDYC